MKQKFFRLIADLRFAIFIDVARNTTNSINASLDLENKVVNFCQRDTISYTSKQWVISIYKIYPNISLLL